MGKKPSPKHSIERRDSNKNYEPSNCYWGTKKEQSGNTSRNVWVKHLKFNMILADWSLFFGISQTVLSARMKKHSFKTIFNSFIDKNGNKIPQKTEIEKKRKIPRSIVDSLREDFKNKIGCTELSNKYNISRSVISAIVHNKTYVYKDE